MSDENQNIENFFQRRLGKKEFPFREEDWALMEAKLDAATPTPAGPGIFSGWRVGAIVALVTIGAFFSGWFLNDFLNSNGKPLTGRNMSEVQKSQMADSSEKAVVTESVPDLSHDQSTVGLTEEKGKIKKTDQETTADVINSKNEVPVSGKHGQVLGVGRENGAIITQTPGQIPLKPISDSQATSEYFTDSQLPLIGITQFSSLEGKNAAKVGHFQFIPTDIPVPENVIPQKSFYRLAIGLSASPDLSSIGFHPSLKEIGKGYGVLLEYNVGRRWKVSSGIYKFDKVYKAGKGDYNPPFRSGWPGGVEPISTDAACNVLDVPVTASFRLASFGKTRLWVSSGISSYWMLSEDYKYNYEDGVEGRYDGWSGKNYSKHLFSVVSASVSVETYINEHFSIQLEPFVKVPLGEVGYGYVHLYTAGSLVTAKYHFFNKP